MVPLFASFQQSGLGSPRIRESAALVAEQLALKERFRDRRAVHGNKAHGACVGCSCAEYWRRTSLPTPVSPCSRTVRTSLTARRLTNSSTWHIDLDTAMQSPSAAQARASLSGLGRGAHVRLPAGRTSLTASSFMPEDPLCAGPDTTLRQYRSVHNCTRVCGRITRPRCRDADEGRAQSDPVRRPAGSA